MAGLTVKLEGLDALRDALRETPRQTRADLSKTLQESGASVVAHARRIVPKDTGALRSSIVLAGKGLTWRAGVESSYLPKKGDKVHINPAAYGTVIHQGTSNHTAVPFMRAPAQAEEAHLPVRLRYLSKRIERYARSSPTSSLV